MKTASIEIVVFSVLCLCDSPSYLKFTCSELIFTFLLDTYHNIRGPLTLGYICTPGTKISALTFQDAEFPKNIIKICTDKNFDGWCDYIDDKVSNFKYEFYCCERSILFWVHT